MEFVAVAKVIKPIGVRGEVKIQLLTDDIERLRQQSAVWIGRAAESAVERTLLRVRQDAKHCVAALQDFLDRDAAESLRDEFIFVPRDPAVIPKAGRFFIDDILGCTMATIDGTHVGTIVDVVTLPANDVWVVNDGKKETLVPAVKAIVKEVDVKQKRVVIDSPEGLIDSCA